MDNICLLKLKPPEKVDSIWLTDINQDFAQTRQPLSFWHQTSQIGFRLRPFACLQKQFRRTFSFDPLKMHAWPNWRSGWIVEYIFMNTDAQETVWLPRHWCYNIFIRPLRILPSNIVYSNLRIKFKLSKFGR